MPERNHKRKSGPRQPKSHADKAKTSKSRGVALPTRGRTAAFAKQLSLPATEAKNRFGEVLKAVSKSGAVFIERHGRHQAVVLDIDTYEALVAKHRTPDEQRLETLRAEFDTLYERMQSASARAATDRLSTISDEELNRIVAPRG